ncbi:MAG: dipeptide epimerase [Fuerstiella sp.]
MKMTLHYLRLPLQHPFTIARGTISDQQSLIVELEHDGLTGFGEVTENRFYGHSFESMTNSLRKVVAELSGYEATAPSEVWPAMLRRCDGDTFALSALDMAAHDLHGRRNQQACWQNWNLDWKTVPPSSFTIGIDDVEVMIRKLQERPGWDVYKIKLGTDNDLQIVQQLRQHTDAAFRVDVNCGWDVDQAIRNSAALADLGVEFLEQPLPLTAKESERARLFRESALPVIADESCQGLGDVENCRHFFHGVNVKLCKCGGLTPALIMLRQARKLGLKTMIGCMVESSIGISGAAQLLPLLDYADLDGAVLLQDEPCQGVVVDRGNVELADQHGCGGSLNRQRLSEFAVQESVVLT